MNPSSAIFYSTSDENVGRPRASGGGSGSDNKSEGRLEYMSVATVEGTLRGKSLSSMRRAYASSSQDFDDIRSNPDDDEDDDGIRRPDNGEDDDDDDDEAGRDSDPMKAFAEYSFRCVPRDNIFRQICIKLVLNPWFERLTMTVILLNCVTLGMYHPCEDAHCDTKRCNILKFTDDIIYLYFTLEMFVKMFGMGIAGKGCYLSETWNRLDCFIVLAGALEYCLDVEKLNLSAIRTVRVLRPLRAINRIPSMRILVMLLLDTLPMLGNVLLLCFFVFFIFGIIGVQLWAGLLRQRCYIPDNMLNVIFQSEYYRGLYGFVLMGDVNHISEAHYLVNSDQLSSQYYRDPKSDLEYICSLPDSSGMHKCSDLPPYENAEGEECHASLKTGLHNESQCINWNQYYTSCKPGETNPFSGAISFDNIGLAWVAIFLVISLEGWTDVMYFVQDAHSFWNWIYFVLLIVIGSFFMINLCLVVIATQFSETKRRETAKMKAERARFRNSSSTLSSFTNSETTNCYRQVIRLIAHLLRKAMCKTVRTYKSMKARHLKKKEISLLQRRDKGKLQNCNVVKNVSTHSVMRAGDGCLELGLELDDVGVCENVKNHGDIQMCEKMTQTEPELLNRSRRSGSQNGRSPCNHPSLTCQELLALSTALSATLTAQIGFDAKHLKHCSTYNLAEGIDPRNRIEGGGRRTIYRLRSDEYELAVTPKRHSRCINFFSCASVCVSKFRKHLEAFVDHYASQRFILFCILINTFSMGIEYHLQPEWLTKTVEISNLVFSIIFSFEMCFKLLAYGFFRYISDGFNVFDGVIVLLSTMEIYTGIVHGIAVEGSGISVLRTFRLLRILKLVRFLPNLRRQLVVMLRTMDNVAVFFGLLMLFIFIFSILGMNLFGCKFCDYTPEGKVCDRKNFDSLLWATVTVFQVLTQEDWNVVLFAGMQKTSHWAALYFVALMTFGNYVLFNLLVAILVEGFSNQDEKRSSDRNSEYSKGELESPGLSLDEPRNNHGEDYDDDDYDAQSETQRDYYRETEMRNRTRSEGSYGNAKTNEYQAHFGHIPKISKQTLENIKKSVINMGEPRQLVLPPCPGCGDNRVVMARQISKQEVESNPIFAELVQKTRMSASADADVFRRHAQRLSGRARRRRTTSSCQCPSEESCSHGRAHHHHDRISNHIHAKKTPESKNGKANSIGRPNQNESLETEEDSNPDNNSRQTIKDCVMKRVNQIRRRVDRLRRRWYKFTEARANYSLWYFKPDDKFRIFCQELTSQNYFDFIVLNFIAANCITLAMERPNIPPWSTEREILDILNHVFTVVFTIEMFLKAVATGLIYGEKAYFKSGWNVMDGSLVIVSLIDTLMVIVIGHSTKIFGILRVFRLVRALRPLRVINRAPGLKLVVQTLLSSLKPIGNIVLICCTFFIIFGILGVQLFKGIFYYCEGPDAEYVKNKTQCIELSGNGNKWVNHKYNFDNLGQALMSLFVLSSKDGWVNIMYQGLDAVGLDQQPRRNYNEWRLLYFISFLLLVGFFVLNMFVGVVVENFHRCRAEQEKEERARRAAKRAKKIEERRRMGNFNVGREMLEAPYYVHYSPTRLLIHRTVTSKYFDLAISAVIGLNVITMAMEFYMMPNILANALKCFNYFFTAVFILEAGMKISALGLGRYLSDRWNQLDVFIVFLSVLGIILEELKSDLMPINPTIMRVMRVLRIARVLKLLKMAKGIRALLDTVMQALPQVGNLGLLFFLLFFIFAALGVEMFGRLECDDEHPCEGLGEHAHFRSFGMAFLTLFRIATGDNWNGIMKDTLREECEEDDNCLRNCCVSPYFAPLFFVVFVLMAQFVLVNVVVAVLMKHLEESHKQAEDDVEVELELEKQLSLAREMF